MWVLAKIWNTYLITWVPPSGWELDIHWCQANGLPLPQVLAPFGWSHKSVWTSEDAGCHEALPEDTNEKSSEVTWSNYILFIYKESHWDKKDFIPTLTQLLTRRYTVSREHWKDPMSFGLRVMLRCTSLGWSGLLAANRTLASGRSWYGRSSMV